MKAQGIRLSVCCVPKKTMGTPTYHLHIGGGRVTVPEPRLGEDGYIAIEVEPEVEIPNGSWRNYDEINDLVDRAEKQGGYMKGGDNIQVGEDILVGRDAMAFVEHWNRRLRDELTELTEKTGKKI